MTNEKYKGDARLQKTFTTDFLTKRKKINEGEVPQYYVENSHSPIISPEAFELVQEEFGRRKVAGSYTSAINCFASRIVCGDCGGFYGSKVWHSSDKYHRTIWQCNHKYKNEEKCQTPHLDEGVIKQVFIEAFNSVLTNKSVILDSYEQIMDRLTDSIGLEKQSDKIEVDMKNIEVLVENLIDKNKSTLLDQSEYRKRYDDYWNEYQELQTHRTEMNLQISQLKVKRSRIQAYIQTLAERDEILSDFDEELFSAMIESITILSRDQVILKFRDETEVAWPLPLKD